MAVKTLKIIFFWILTNYNFFYRELYVSLSGDSTLLLSYATKLDMASGFTF